MRRCSGHRVIGVLIVALAACGAPVQSVTTTVAPTTSTTVAPTTVAPTTMAPTTVTPTTVTPTTTVPVVLADPTDETFGGLARGVSAAAVKALFGPPTSTTVPWPEGATGYWVSTWEWSSIGLELRMVSSEAGSAQRVDSITVSSPFALRTTRGIGIGSSRQDVKTAYAEPLSQHLWDLPAETADGVLIGTPYGGTYFALEHDLVVRIFVGAAAE